VRSQSPSRRPASSALEHSAWSSCSRTWCIPPDLYLRVGRERGWGQRPEWTHFDGYRVLERGRLLALVGGNSRYGGLVDLCGISPMDERENVVARFAVLRRARLGARPAT
jgi:hypothetical protein